MKKTLLTYALLLFAGTASLSAEPEPGDIFREYYWYNKTGEADYALRVGALDGDTGYGGGIINLSHAFDLEHAVKAEVVVEKILSHISTTGLAININENGWTLLPVTKGFPNSAEASYQHHTYPVMEIPLSWLKESPDNVFQMRTWSVQPWGWPQNLVNGVHFRIYYDPAKKSHPDGEIVDPHKDSTIGESVTFRAETSSPDTVIKQVDFVGLYEDVNYEGDGIYYQWHYHYYHGRIMHHIGTAGEAPFEVTWDTSWVPDQDQPMQFAARIIDTTGMIYMTEPVSNVSLDRGTVSVELSKPYDVSTEWSTRLPGKGESFDITGNPAEASAAQLVWTSWCPGYMNGIYINDVKVFDKEGPLYKYYFHRVAIDSPGVLNQGVNTLRTGDKKEINGELIHGMEVQWPGMMVLLRYEDKNPVTVGESISQPAFELTGNYPNPFNMSTTIQYTLHEQAEATCRIYSLSGQVVRTLASTLQEAGTQEIVWDGTDEAGTTVASGMYLFTLGVGNRISTQKLLFMK